jgi:hypothetical protein
MESEGSLPCSQELAIGLNPETLDLVGTFTPYLRRFKTTLREETAHKLLP